MKTQEEIQNELREFESLVSNPLNALRVYAPFKRFRRYYVLVVYKNLHHDVKQSLGKKMLDAVFECDLLLPRCQFGNKSTKLAATEDFMHNFSFLLSGVEFLALSNVGLSIKQATELVMLIKEIQAQMGAFSKYLKTEGSHQFPQPTGEGSE